MPRIQPGLIIAAAVVIVICAGASGATAQPVATIELVTAQTAEDDQGQALAATADARADALTASADLLMAENRVEEAERAYREAVTIISTAHGENYVFTSWALHKHITSLDRLGKIGESEIARRRLLAIAESWPDREPYHIAGTREDMAQFLASIGKFDEAIAFGELAMDAFESEFVRTGINGDALEEQYRVPSHITRLTTLAKIYQRAGRVADAERLTARAHALSAAE